MKKLIATVAFTTALAAPACGQSFDPSVGSGNIASQVKGDNAYGAHAQHAPMPTRRQDGTRAVHPFTAAEKALFDRIRKE
jgi:hypothetical protein